MASAHNRSDFAVLVVAYNRPQQLAELLNSLSGNHFIETDVNIIVSIDGPKDKLPASLVKHSAVLEVAKHYREQNVVTDIITQKSNLGTARNMVHSISYAFQFSDYVLVIEDDLVLTADIKNISKVAKSYLNPKNTALSIYVNHTKNKKDAFLSHRFNSQGWMTHIDYWKDFDINHFRSFKLNSMQKKKIQKLLGSDILRDFTLFKKGKIDTWAVPWNIYNFLNDRKMIYPNRSYIVNNSHFVGAERTYNILYPYEIADKKLTDLDFENLELCPRYVQHYSFCNRLRRRLRSYAQRYL